MKSLSPSPALPQAAPAVLDEPTQHEITRLCAHTAVLLMQHGAESALAEGMARRLGPRLGVASVDVALMASAIIVTTVVAGRGVTVAQRCEDRGINMHLVIEVQRAVLDFEAGRIDAAAYRERLHGVQPLRYPAWLVALAVGLACAAFARLAGADAVSCLVALAASGAAMVVRLRLARAHFNPLLNFFVTAFVATSVAALGMKLDIGAQPRTAMAASVLMLVPGFPLINAVSDMVKGYATTGITRWTVATMLSAATCGGILLATNVWGVWGWR